jgi:hypothetical protein
MRKAVIIGAAAAAVAAFAIALRGPDESARIESRREAIENPTSTPAEPRRDASAMHASASPSPAPSGAPATTALVPPERAAVVDERSDAPDVTADVATASATTAAVTSRDQPLAVLRRKLEDPDPQKRAAAVHQTSPIGDGAVVLEQALQNDANANVRVSAALQLAGGSGFAVIRGLLGALDDADTSVVEEALRSLATVGDPTIIPELEKLKSTHTEGSVAKELHATIETLGAQRRLPPSRPVFNEESSDLAPSEETFARAKADVP